MARLVLVLISLALWTAVFFVMTSPFKIDAKTVKPRTPDLENGRVLFLAGGCASCHATPGSEDTTRLGGGLTLTTGFGAFRAPNISPHPQDGIGAWSDLDFANALLRGVAPDGSHYYPAFPYTAYQKLRVEDVQDIFAYIKTLPPVPGRQPGHDLAFPYSVRRAVGLWKLQFADRQPFSPDPAQSAEWNRGAYLVEAAGHCAECHSPRNFMGGIIADERYAGGPNPTHDAFVPNITQHPSRGIGSWSVADIKELLTTGFTPEFDSVGSNMAAVVRNTSKLSEADRQAMAVYIKSLAPVEGPDPKAR